MPDVEMIDDGANLNGQCGDNEETPGVEDETPGVDDAKETPGVDDETPENETESDEVEDKST